MRKACGGSGHGPSTGPSTKRHPDQRSRHPGRADDDGSHGHDRCRARCDRVAEPAPAAAADTAGGLLCHGSGALYAQAFYGEVLRCLLEGVRWLRLRGADVASADRSAITNVGSVLIR